MNRILLLLSVFSLGFIVANLLNASSHPVKAYAAPTSCGYVQPIHHN